jgi:SH3-like domain-containing protein
MTLAGLARIARRAAAVALMVAFAGGSAGGTAAEPGARGPVTNLPLPRYVSLRAESANARRGPDFDQRVDWEFVRRGLPLQIVAEYGLWRRVIDSEGVGGWVHNSLLSGARTGLVQGDASVALHAAPSERSAVRALAEPGVIARIDGCEAEWCDVAASGFRGWVPRNVLWGVDPDETID